MPNFHDTNFEEKSGVVACEVAWGRWWQSVAGVSLEIPVAEGTRAKAVTVAVTPSKIRVVVAGDTVIEGALYGKVIPDELVWTLEESGGRRCLCVCLTKLGGGTLGPSKGQTGGGEGVWPSLLAPSPSSPSWEADPFTLKAMREKFDLEKFQIENPGFDFSSAKLSKCYDKLPAAH